MAADSPGLAHFCRYTCWGPMGRQVTRAMSGWSQGPHSQARPPPLRTCFLRATSQPSLGAQVPTAQCPLGVPPTFQPDPRPRPSPLTH